MKMTYGTLQDVVKRPAGEPPIPLLDGIPAVAVRKGTDLGGRGGRVQSAFPVLPLAVVHDRVVRDLETDWSTSRKVVSTFSIDRVRSILRSASIVRET